MAIIYTEKGNRLHEVIEDAGHWLHEHNGVWISSNDIAVQAIIDEYNPLPIEQEKAVMEIAEYANNLIDSNVNPIKAKRIQADALAATIRKGKGAISSAEQAKLDRYELAVVYPEAIFAQYDIEEALILGQTDCALIAGIVETAKANLDSVT